MRIRTETNSFQIIQLADGAKVVDSDLIEIGGSDLALLFLEFH